MIFSINNIKKKKEKNTINENRSLFEKCLDYIRENNCYRIISESLQCDSDSIYTLDKDKIIEAVKCLCDSSRDNLTRLFKDYILLQEKYIKEAQFKISKDALYNIDNDFSYDDYRYQYTNLRKVLMYSSFKMDISKESDLMIQQLNDFIVAKNFSELYNVINTFNEFKENIDINLDMIRAEILGMNGPVDNSLFPSKLYANFRNDCNKIEAGSYISKSELLQIYDRVATNEVEKNIIKNDYMKFINDIAIITSKLDQIPFDNLSKDTMRSEFAQYPADVIYTWINICKIILDIYQIYFAARMDACLECLITYINILIDATDYVNIRQQTEDNKQ